MNKKIANKTITYFGLSLLLVLFHFNISCIESNSPDSTTELKSKDGAEPNNTPDVSPDSSSLPSELQAKPCISGPGVRCTLLKTVCVDKNKLETSSIEAGETIFCAAEQTVDGKKQEINSINWAYYSVTSKMTYKVDRCKDKYRCFLRYGAAGRSFRIYAWIQDENSNTVESNKVELAVTKATVKDKFGLLCNNRFADGLSDYSFFRADSNVQDILICKTKDAVYIEDLVYQWRYKSVDLGIFNYVDINPEDCKSGLFSPHYPTRCWMNYDSNQTDPKKRVIRIPAGTYEVQAEVRKKDSNGILQTLGVSEEHSLKVVHFDFVCTQELNGTIKVTEARERISLQPGEGLECGFRNPSKNISSWIDQMAVNGKIKWALKTLKYPGTPQYEISDPYYLDCQKSCSGKEASEYLSKQLELGFSSFVLKVEFEGYNETIDSRSINFL